jgi:branched-chain amino acid aminotransferase
LIPIQIDTAFTPDPARREAILKQELGFGRFFTDRMFTVRYDDGEGWHSARVTRYEAFHLPPAAAVFHYGQAIFEGMKAYGWPDDEVRLFRPDRNAQRFRLSAQRLVMATVPEPLFVDAIETLVDIEREWVPRGDRQSLYVRPFMIATEPLQGVRPSNQYLFSVILSPVGAYYSSGFKPVKILITDEFARAAAGGTGEAKAAGNYAASLLAGTRARDEGCSQVLWLDGAEHKYIEEIGAMNVLFVIDGKIVTSPLTGTILPGVTRETILDLAPSLGLEIEERPLSVDELIDAIASGRCTEAFGAGTAAVITAISSFRFREQDHVLGEEAGPIAQKFHDTITGIQWGREPDPHGWTRVVERRNETVPESRR